jgi:hypothetical protein
LAAFDLASDFGSISDTSNQMIVKWNTFSHSDDKFQGHKKIIYHIASFGDLIVTLSLDRTVKKRFL